MLICIIDKDICLRKMSAINQYNCMKPRKQNSWLWRTKFMSLVAIASLFLIGNKVTYPTTLISDPPFPNRIGSFV